MPRTRRRRLSTGPPGPGTNAPKGGPVPSAAAKFAGLGLFGTRDAEATAEGVTHEHVQSIRTLHVRRADGRWRRLQQGIGAVAHRASRGARNAHARRFAPRTALAARPAHD